MDGKLRIFLMALRAIASEFIAAIEDVIDMPYDQSSLHKRRRKVNHNG